MLSQHGELKLRAKIAVSMAKIAVSMAVLETGEPVLMRGKSKELVQASWITDVIQECMLGKCPCMCTPANKQRISKG